MALQLATDASRRIELQIQQAFTPVIALDILIQQKPLFPDTLRIFPGVAAQLLRKVLPGTITNLQLAPNLKVQAIYPLAGNEAVLGMDLLAPTSNPLRLEDVKWSITNRNVTVSGPYRLLQGGYGVLVRQPIFIPNVTADERFGANATSQPCPQCYDPASGTRFWGFAQGMARLDGLLQGSDNRMRALNDYGPWHLSRVLPNGTEVVIASHGPGADCYGQDSVAVAVTLPNSAWRLYLGKRGGWAPNWRGLVALVVVGSCVVSLLLFGLLVAAQRHRALLRAMFPAKVLRPLQQGKNFSEEFDSVTILFSDIVSYTTISSSLRPIEVAEMLNELYCEFDELVDKNGCYKIETIGDAFMAVGGCPTPEAPEAAAQRVANMALDMVARARSFRSAKGHLLRIRVGLASGPVAAAVIGRKMPRYCLFGDTVNLASRMESSSEPMRIQVASTTAMLLRRCNGAESFRLLPRGPINVKGKGAMECFWLEPSGHMLLQEPQSAPTIANGQAELTPRSRFHLPPLLHRTPAAPLVPPSLQAREQGPEPEPSDAAAAGAGPEKDDKGLAPTEVESEMLAAMCTTVPSTTCSSSLVGMDLWSKPPPAGALTGPAPRVPPSIGNGNGKATLFQQPHFREASTGSSLATKMPGRREMMAAASMSQLTLSTDSFGATRPVLSTGSGGAVAGGGLRPPRSVTGLHGGCGQTAGATAAAAAASLSSGQAGALMGPPARPTSRGGPRPLSLMDLRASSYVAHDGEGGGSGEQSGNHGALHWTTRHLVCHGDGGGSSEQCGLGNNSTSMLGGHSRSFGGSFVSPLAALAPVPTPTATASHLDITISGGCGDGGGRAAGMLREHPVTMASSRNGRSLGKRFWPISLAGRASTRNCVSGSDGAPPAAADVGPDRDRVPAAGPDGAAEGWTGVGAPSAAAPGLLRWIGLGHKVATMPALTPDAQAAEAAGLPSDARPLSAGPQASEAPAVAPAPAPAVGLAAAPAAAPAPASRLLGPRPAAAAQVRALRPNGSRTAHLLARPDSAASSCTVAEEPAEEALAQRTGSCCRGVGGEGNGGGVGAHVPCEWPTEEVGGPPDGGDPDGTRP